MKRREVLKSLGIGVTASFTLSAWLSACAEDEKGPEIKYDGVVGIIGAGAAGLAAADYLRAKGVAVKVYEASGRLGGRVSAIRQSDPIFTNLAADFPVELGADRIFGTDSAFGIVLKQERIATILPHQAPANGRDYYVINDQYYNESEANAMGDFAAVKAFRDTGIKTYTGSSSVKDAAPVTPAVEGVLNAWLGNAYGTSADRIGAQALGEALALIEHDQEEVVVRAQPIGNVLTLRYERALNHVQLNTAIKKVEYAGDTINLTVLNRTTNTESQEIVNKLIVTAPVKVLKDSTLLSFDPSLPASKQAALGRIEMDASIRVVLEFTRNEFFRKPVDSPNQAVMIYGGTEVPAYFLSGTGRSSLNRTMCFTINGPKAEALATKTDQEIANHILAEMDVVFDGKGSLNVRKYPSDHEFAGEIICAVKDWSKEPYIQGGQSYPLPGGTNDDRVALAESIDGKLFFAGEATDMTGDFGTVNGAIKSASRAAEEVIAAIVAENTTPAS